MAEAGRKSGRIRLLLMALVFFGPLVVAVWMYYGGQFAAPKGRSNHGALLEPIVSLPEMLPESTLYAGSEGFWVLLYLNPGECAAECRQALYTGRQARKMLGRDMQRLRQVFLHGESTPDTVFLAREHQGLITIEDASLLGLLEKKRPATLSPGGYYLVDPLGNLVMYFRPDIDPGRMVDDVQRLLRLSRIG